MNEMERDAALPKCLNSMALKWLAMALMFCDHLRYVLPEGSAWDWLNWIGRLAFPIFAFQIVEGFVHTHSFRRYWLRMFLFALISEIPFNLFVEGQLLFPRHQNVMFTFCIALPLLKCMEAAKGRGRLTFALTSAACAVLGYLIGYVAQVDYFGLGTLTVMLFYLCRDRRHGRWMELAGMLLIHLFLAGIQSIRWFTLGFATYADFGAQAGSWATLGGWEFFFPVLGPGFAWMPTTQVLATLGLIPIWLYSGKPGPRSRALQYAGYAFYPAHLLLLFLLQLL